MSIVLSLLERDKTGDNIIKPISDLFIFISSSLRNNCSSPSVEKDVLSLLNSKTSSILDA